MIGIKMQFDVGPQMQFYSKDVIIDDVETIANTLINPVLIVKKL